MLLKNAALESGWGWPVKEFFNGIYPLVDLPSGLPALCFESTSCMESL
jgi:hypothetical protein